MCTTRGERRLIRKQIGHFLLNDAELDQNITCCSRVGAFSLTDHGRTDRRTDAQVYSLILLGHLQC